MTDTATGPRQDVVARRPLPSPRRVGWAVGLGLLLVQLAWVLAVPTFEGMDEFDHVYKADAVAHGELVGSRPAPEGRGDLMSVTPETVDAAAATCRSYPYTLPDDCRAVARDGDRVLVGSAAAAYDPVYYLAVGLPTRVLGGDAAVLAVRVLTAALCAALLGAAAAVTAGWARNRMPLLALAVSVTPTVLYSGSVVAPNGVGYAAACLWWAAALGLVTGDRRRAAWGPLTLATAAVACTHTTNLAWLPVMSLAVLALRPLPWWRRALAPRVARVALGLMALSVLASALWVRLAGTNRMPDEPLDLVDLSAHMIANAQVLWLQGGIGAFPMRNEPAPLPVHVLWVLALGLVLVAGAVVATRRVRLAMALVAVVWLVAPVVLTVATYDAIGLAWQGRYVLPLVTGLPALAGLALHQRGWELPHLAVVGCLASLALAHVLALCVVTVMQSQALSWALVDHLPGTPVLLGALTVLGMAVALSPFVRRAAPPERTTVAS